MEFSVDHPDFKNGRLVVRSAGFWGGAKLLLDGVQLEGKKKSFRATDDNGREREVKLKSSILDPIPTVIVDGANPIELVRPIAWYEYLWMGLPIVLVLTGGAIGGMFGYLTAYANARIFRGDRSTLMKYILTGLLSTACVVAFSVIVVLFHAVVDPQGDSSVPR